MSENIPEKRWHRIRFYEGRWSTFDLVEECSRPGFCVGCTYKHPFCSETGRIIEEAKSP